MKKEKFLEELITFIKEGTCAFTSVNNLKNEFLNRNYVELDEKEIWEKLPSLFFVTRNDSSIIAIKIPDKYTNSFHITTTHLDTPSLTLKPSGEYISENYLQYNVIPYGGLLNYGWLDKNLSLAGRIMLKSNNKWIKKIIDLKKTIAVIPSVAIHQNDKANSNLDLNMQTDLQPVLALTEEKKDWQKLLKENLNIKAQEKIGDFELFLYDNSEPVLYGMENEFLLSPRIDNLTSVFAAFKSFLEADSSSISVFCSFNNEEIGSLTKEGADGNFLLDTLKKVAAILNLDITSTFANSWIISSDNTHAIHPNHKEYADNTGKGYMNKGFAIMKEINSTTDAIFSTILKDICNNHKIKYQDVTTKNDIVGGSTLSGLSLRHVSVSSIDVGIVELAMHSSKELCATNDIFELYKMMKAFYNTNIVQKKETIFFD